MYTAGLNQGAMTVRDSSDACSSLAVATLAVTAAASAAGAWWLLVAKPNLEKRRPYDSLPLAKNSHWLWGHQKSFAVQPHELSEAFLSNVDENGRQGMWFAIMPCISVTRWQDARAILQVETHRFQVPIFQRVFRQVFGDKNILALNGKEWKYHRAAMMKAFTPSALDSYREAMVHVSDRIVSSLKKRVNEQGGSFQMEIETVMKMVTLDVFGAAALGSDFECTSTLTPSHLALTFETIMTDINYRIRTNLLKPTNFLLSLPTERNRKLLAAVSDLRSFIAETVRERKLDESTKHKDLLQLLMDAGEVDLSDESTIDAVSDMLSIVLFAGYDTTSITLTYCLYLLSQYPQVEANLLKEIESLSAPDAVEEMVYCKAIIRESLRLYPPATVVSRTLTRAITLDDGFEVPQGASVLMPVWVMHRDERNFARAEEFLPERWARKEGNKWVERQVGDTSGDVPAADYRAFFSFGSGARNCAGFKFAYQEAEIVLSRLVKELRFEALPDYKLVPSTDSGLQHPKDLMPMKISVRK